MKNLILNIGNKTIVMLIMMSSIIISCDDFLEVVPKESISDLTLWTDKGNAEFFLNGIYGSIRGPISLFDAEDNYTDNSICQHAWPSSRARYLNGTYTPTTQLDLHQWDLQYSNIRKCNMFITNVTASELDTDWKKLRIAEARFLRAYFYSLLWTTYGGVPLITDVLDRHTQGDGIFRPRATDQETFQFIVNECAAVVDDLPVKPTKSRVGKGAALTLKGWCELYYASPLKNPSNDKSRWAAAAASNKQVMDLNVYSLFPNHATLFHEANNHNVEVIFDKSYLGGTNIGNSRSGLQPIGSVGPVQRSWSGVNPLQSLVDEYAMANGLPISDPGSGYDPTKPYVGREQRFYNDLFYDGLMYDGYECVYWVGSGSRNEQNLAVSGGNRPVTVNHPKKGIEPKYHVNGWNYLSSANWVIFRYAEVLLSYAEAQNEAVGPDINVYNAINAVRARVNLSPLPEGLTQDQMRTAIYRERRVELCFEDKRLNDLKRLKLAEVLYPGPARTLTITKDGGGNKLYTLISIKGINRQFNAAKNYLLPIPQTAMDQNDRLVQNPGYGSN